MLVCYVLARRDQNIEVWRELRTSWGWGSISGKCLEHVQFAFKKPSKLATQPGSGRLPQAPRGEAVTGILPAHAPRPLDRHAHQHNPPMAAVGRRRIPAFRCTQEPIHIKLPDTGWWGRMKQRWDSSRLAMLDIEITEEVAP